MASFVSQLAAGVPALRSTRHAMKDASAPVTSAEADSGAETVRAKLHEVEIERWLDSVASHTARTTHFPLGREAAVCLHKMHRQSVQGVLGELTPAERSTLAALEAEIDEHIRNFGGVAFLKISSRSPKDITLGDEALVARAQQLLADEEWLAATGLASMPASDNARLGAVLQAGQENMGSHSGGEAVRRFVASARIFEDLDLELSQDPSRFAMNVVVREWLTMGQHLEVRAFVHNNELRCACQYNHPVHYPILATRGHELSERIRAFFASEIQPHLRFIGSYVIDFGVVGYDIGGRIVVIEINPYNNFAGCGVDADLFDWDKREEIEQGEYKWRIREAPMDLAACDHRRIRLVIQKYFPIMAHAQQ